MSCLLKDLKMKKSRFNLLVSVAQIKRRDSEYVHKSRVVTATTQCFQPTFVPQQDYSISVRSLTV